MRRIFTCLVLTACLFDYGRVHAQTVLWSEDFEGESNNATTGTAAGTIGGSWSVTQLPPNGAGSFSRQSTGGNNRFTLNGTGSAAGAEGVWSSGVININGQGQVALEITLVNFYANNSGDYLRAYYKLNGSPTEIPFGSITGGNDYEVSSRASAIITGTSVEIIVRGRENSSGNVFFFIPRMLRFDDVRLIKIGTLYSRANGNWATGTTWTTDPVGNASCGCTPSDDTHAVIRHTVDVNGNGDVIDLTVNSGATLRWTGNYTLTAARGGDLVVNGTVTRNGNTGNIVFEWDGVSNAITVNSPGSVSLTDLYLEGASTMSIGGSGNITLNGDIIANAQVNVTNNLTGTFSAADLIINSSNSVFTNQRTLTLSGNLSTTAGGNTFTNTSTGTLTVVGINPNDVSLTINNSGTINQSGAFSNIATTCDFNNLANAIWNFSSTTAPDTDIPTVLDCSAAGNTFSYSAAGAQNVQPITYHHLTLSGSGTRTTVGNLDINGNLLITGSVRFNVDNADNNINLAGNWTNNSTNPISFVEGSTTETVTFDGTGNQIVTNAVAETYNRVVVDKSAGTLTLAGNHMYIANTTGTGLTLTRGIVNTSATAFIIINDNVTSTSGNVNSFVDGFIQKIGDDAFVFPTGDGTVWARIGISAPTSSSTFSAQYFDGAYASLQNNGSLDNVSGREYWTLDRNAGTGSANVRLFWESNSRSQIDDITTPDLIVARYNGTQWVTAGRSSISSLPITTGSVTSTSMSSFSPFTFGSLGHPANPLPITLKYFKAMLVNDRVNLSWETAQEIDNDYFTVERATNLESFDEVIRLKGQGTTNTAHTYSTTDLQPLYGKSYYRLKQTDFDGKFSYSDLQAIDYEGPAFATVRAYPNPGTGTSLTVEVNGLKEAKEVQIQILNQQGQQVLTRVLPVKDAGSVREELTFRQTLSPGLYLLRAGPTKYLTLKFVVE